MAKTSARAAAAKATREDARVRAKAADASSLDSFVNFAHKLGVGADNALSTATYGFNPITRNRILLEWMHRGSWIAGRVIDTVADDMTRAGIEYTSEMPPEDHERLDAEMQARGVWPAINEVIRWGRLYGGCVGVVLIDGQDFSTPLKADRVGEGAFRGVLPLDRWMLEPALEDLVTELGPHLGLPKYYRVSQSAPALRGKTVHYSRCVFRHVGVKLPYQQRLTEMLWGVSVLERMYDRMLAYDSASTGAAQLVYKAHLRTLKIKGLREVVAAGGKVLDGVVRYTDLMRKYQGLESVTLVDAEDEFEAQVHGAFSGLDDVLTQFAQQLSGATEIPLTRLFGQSPGGLGDGGDHNMRNYYDSIKQDQESELRDGVLCVYRCAAMSLGITLPDNFGLNFRSLWELTDTDKANIAKTVSDAVLGARDAGIISDQTALQELRQQSRVTGVFTNVTQEKIDDADDELPDPTEGLVDPATGLPVMPGGEGGPNKEAGNGGQQVRPEGQAGKMGGGKERRRAVPKQADAGGPAG